MTDTRIYLAGPIAGLTVGRACGWRDRAADVLGFKGAVGVNPMRGKEATHSVEEEIGYPTLGDDGLFSDRVIVERDLRDLRSCDGLLVQVGFDPEQPIHPMTGTICEVFAAKYMLPSLIPCVAFTDEDLHVHPQFYSPWFGQFITPRYRVYRGMDDAIQVLMEVL